MDFALTRGGAAWHDYLINKGGGTPHRPKGITMNTTATLAADFDTDARTLRKFLRSADSGITPVGKGARYALPATKREVSALRKKFNAWNEAQVEARKARSEAQEAPEAEITADAEVEPTAEDLEMIENGD